MTLASDIISRAFREGQIVAIVSTPTTAEQNEALALLNPLLLSVLGNEAGQDIHDLNIGGSFDQSQFVSTWVPENSRLVLNLSSGRTLSLHPEPYNGQRLAVIDVGGNLAAANLVLSGNGRLIEAASSLTLNTNSLSRQWMFRSDIGNWVKMTDLALSDTIPFPEEFDDFFVLRLAMRLFPRNGISMSQESASVLQRAETQLRARFRRPRPAQETGTLGLMGQRRFGYPIEGWLYR